MDLSQKQIETPQGRIAYFMTPPRAGAPVVLLLHGLSSNHTTWRPLMETLSARGFVCIAPDVRGHGHSDKTKRRSFYTLPVFCDDIRRVLAAENCARASVIGYSFGGSIALAFAAQFPESVERLVLLSTNFLPPAKYMHLHFLTPIVCGALELLAVLFLWQGREPYYYYEHGTAQSYWQSTRRGFATMPLSINWWMLRGEIWGHDSRVVEKVVAPTLLIRGDSDGFLSDAEMHDMARRMRNARTATVFTGGHFIGSRAHDEVTPLVLDFLSQH